jgi:hypothetical protein
MGLPHEVATYLFLHRELIGVYDFIFGEYSGDYRFIPPNSDTTDRFENLLQEYLELEVDKKWHYVIDRMPLLKLRGFRSLTDQYDKNIVLWQRLKASVDQDLDYIENNLTNDYNVPDNLRVIAYELHDLLKEHKKLREGKFLDIDKDKALLIINGRKLDIEIDSKPYKFLWAIFKKHGEIASYKELANEMELNSYSEDLPGTDFKREIQQIKNKLLSSLEVKGVNSLDIDKISDAIQAVRGRGYKLKSF